MTVFDVSIQPIMNQLLACDPYIYLENFDGMVFFIYQRIELFIKLLNYLTDFASYEKDGLEDKYKLAEYFFSSL